MGFPVESEKVEGPATCIGFLGLVQDTIAMEVRLPADKLEELTRKWASRKAGKKREMLSLLGILNHACKAVWQGRSFLRRLIDTAESVHLYA